MSEDNDSLAQTLHHVEKEEPYVGKNTLFYDEEDR